MLPFDYEESDEESEEVSNFFYGYFLFFNGASFNISYEASTYF